MIRVSCCTLCVFELVGCVAQVDAPRVPEPIDDVASALLVYHDDSRACTAVAITADTALTVEHCTRSDKVLDNREILSVDRDPDADLATLTVSPPFETWLDFSSEPIRAGDLVQVWGYGCGESGAQGQPEARAAVALSGHSARAKTCHGDSGGAVIGLDGLAGIVWGVSDELTEFTPLLD